MTKRFTINNGIAFAVVFLFPVFAFLLSDSAAAENLVTEGGNYTVSGLSGYDSVVNSGALSIDVDGTVFGVPVSGTGNTEFVLGNSALAINAAITQSTVSFSQGVSPQSATISAGYAVSADLLTDIGSSNSAGLVVNGTVNGNISNGLYNAGSRMDINTGAVINGDIINSGYIVADNVILSSGISGTGQLTVSGAVGYSGTGINQESLVISGNSVFTSSSDVTVNILSAAGTNAGYVNNGSLTVDNTIDAGAINISGTGSITAEAISVDSEDEITQETIILTGHSSWLYGTVNSDVVLAENKSGYEANYGTINGDLTMMAQHNTVWMNNYGTINGNLLLEGEQSLGFLLYGGYELNETVYDHSVVTGLITNNIAYYGSGALYFNHFGSNEGKLPIEITGGITRTADGLGNLYMGWNNGATAIIKSTVEKQEIKVGYNVSGNHLIVDHEHSGLIQNSSIIIGSNNALTANASDLVNIGTFYNNGTITFTGGTNNNVISKYSGNSYLYITGDVSNAAAIDVTFVEIDEGASLTLAENGAITLDGSIENNGTLNINEAEFSVALGGAKLNNHGLVSFGDTGTLQAYNIFNHEGSTMSVRNIENLTFNNLANNGLLNVKGTLSKSVSGSGTVSVLNGSLTVNDDVSIGSNSTLITDQTEFTARAGLFAAPVTNNGRLNLSQGTLSQNISGPSGQTYIDSGSGTVTIADNVVLSQSLLYNAGGSTLIANAGSFSGTDEVRNNGSIELTGGTLSSPVSTDGAGQLSISGNVALEGISIANNINVGSNASLDISSHAVSVTGNIAMSGMLKMRVSGISADSSAYEGGSLNVNGTLDIAAEGTKLGIVVDGALERGEHTGNLQLVSATAMNGEFESLQDLSNHRYAVTSAGGGLYNIAMLRTISETVSEGGGNSNVSAAAEAWENVSGLGNDKAAALKNKIMELSQLGSPKDYVNELKKIMPGESNAVQSAALGIISEAGRNLGNRTEARQLAMTDSRFRGLASGDSGAKNSVWAKAMGSFSSKSGAGEFDSMAAGTMAGFDRILDSGLLLGIGYAYSGIDADAEAHDLTATGHSVFLYAGRELNDSWNMHGNIMYGTADYEDKTSEVSSEYKVQNYGAEAVVSYRKAGKFLPEAGIRYAHIAADDYKDSIGSEISSDADDIFTGIAGLGYSFPWKDWKAMANIRFSYDLMSDDRKTSVKIGDQSYHIVSGKMDPFGVEAGISGSKVFGGIELNLAYDFTYKNEYMAHHLSAKGTYRF